ncbi:MAG: trehalase family glycosidase [Burkholderiales bacterium]
MPRAEPLTPDHRYQEPRHPRYQPDGGEYSLQDGFGWTNGVTRALIEQYPEHPASAAAAGG